MATESLSGNDPEAVAPAGTQVSVVIPVYMNASSLPELFDALRAVEASLAQRALGLQLVFVDDGSSDESLGELLKIKAARASTTIVKLTRQFRRRCRDQNRTALCHGDAFAFLAADLQDPRISS
jgi:dolichol-phosphate mannosyltransferase